MDESESDRRKDPNSYLLAAAVFEDHVCDDARAIRRDLKLKEDRKLHWHKESHPRRRNIVSRISDLEVIHMVIVRNGRPGERSERRRRKCLEKLFCELESADVAKAVLEARERKQNLSDVQMLQSMRSRRLLRTDFRIEHLPGPAEELLWVADAVAGAVTAKRCGNSEFLDVLGSCLELHEIDA
ncbi:hypothetical protein [Nocardiopsis dassonvillei]|uniref:hypothetical protein n=1 Tax=Nocardiopsis dassonvillei TaxID=2014 RepID=UPI003555D681